MSNINKEELMRGLSDSQVNKSKQDFGTNALAKKETESLWSMFIGAFDDIWIKVLNRYFRYRCICTGISGRK